MKANWLGAAMADDNLVAELLLRLHRPYSIPAADWGIRRPRSKAAASNESSWRRSPTTPLSWTGESSRPLVLAARFKGSATTDTTNSASASKRSRRKRTFPELKEDESSLIKEREYLNKQIESLHVKLEEQKLLNERLKRIEIDLHAQSATLNEQVGAIASSNNAEHEREASTSGGPSNVSKTIKSEETSALGGDYCPVLNGASMEPPHIFVLPDLNMTPESLLEMS